MNNRLGSWMGLLVLLAGAAGVYLLFRHGHPVEEEAEIAVETVVPVRVAQVRRMTMHEYVRAYGLIAPEPGIGETTPASVRIVSPVDGLVSEVRCKVGQEVRQGQVLFALYDRPARLAVEQAETAVAFAEKNFERQEKLQQFQGTSARIYLEAQQLLDSARNQLGQAQTELDLLKVTAPFDGTILDVQARTGQTVLQADALGELMDPKRLVARVRVPGPETARLKPGQRVEFETTTAGETPDPRAPAPGGRVVYVDPRVDPGDGTVTVVVTLPPGAPEVMVRSGQFVRVRIMVAEYTDRLAVPAESVVTTPEGQTVVAIVRGDEAIPLPVRRVVREAGWVEVEGPGLQPGMKVVTEGAYGLPGQTRIRVIGP